jgi:hypothetical protein
VFINVLRRLCKVSFILSEFKENWIFLGGCSNSFENNTLRKLFQRDPRCSVWRDDQSDVTETIGVSCESALKSWPIAYVTIIAGMRFWKLRKFFIFREQKHIEIERGILPFLFLPPLPLLLLFIPILHLSLSLHFSLKE